jgi:hypothetical protein
VAVVAAVALLGGGDDKAPKTASATATPTADGTASATPTPAAGTERGDVTVAVLNGTTISGLASTLADRIAAAGFKRGETANYVDQARADTLVLFGDASGARRAAFEVAKVIDAGSPPQVQPADESAKRLAPSAQVVVVVGADQSP